MTQSELKQAMTALHSECIKNATNFETPNFKQIIAKLELQTLNPVWDNA